MRTKVLEAWKVIIQPALHEPVALVLTRQALPTSTAQEFAPCFRPWQGAYVSRTREGGRPDVILMGTGSEVRSACKAQEQLKTEGESKLASSAAIVGAVLRSSLPSTARACCRQPVTARGSSVEQAVTFGGAAMVGLRRAGRSACRRSAPRHRFKELQKNTSDLLPTR